jgi:4a-hydroxytetrahydrobiopterin dehydratase
MPTPQALSQNEIEKRLKDLPNWKLEDKTLVWVRPFPSYLEALEFVYQLGKAAEEADHHPDIIMNYKQVTVRYSTHSAGGITDLDFKMAGKVDGLSSAFSEKISR